MCLEIIACIAAFGEGRGFRGEPQIIMRPKKHTHTHNPQQKCYQCFLLVLVESKLFTEACYIGLGSTKKKQCVPKMLAFVDCTRFNQSLFFLGTCPGLYTKNELHMITSNLLPVGQRGIRRAEHLDIAQERFFRRVKSHLHVVVCLKYSPLVTSTSPSQAQIYRFPILLTRCSCVDTYLPWPHDALASIAEKMMDVRELSPIPWKKDKAIYTNAICSIMAHVHLTSRSAVHNLYGIQGLKFYSPDTYLDFVELFKVFCERICVNEKVSIPCHKFSFL